MILASCLGTISVVSAATAQTGDSVTGPAQIVVRGLTLLDVVFDAHSGPSGEQPQGTVGGVRVTCLRVSGDQATIGLVSGVLLFAEDNDGAGQDRIGVADPPSVPITACPDPALLLATGLRIGPVTITGGDIVVIDAPALPTSTDQCKNGGWRNFPDFKNQGQCVAFVQRGAKPGT